MSFYSEIVKYYDAIFPLNEVKEGFVRDMIISNNYGSLLDIGCATGSLCGAMAKHLDRVDGFDLDETMVARAQMFYKYNNLTFKVGNMLEIDNLYTDKFDFITCFGNTLVHVGDENIPDLFKAIKGKLNDGGAFLLQILNYDHVFENKLDKLPLIDNERIRFDRFYSYNKDNSIQFRTVLTVKEDNSSVDNEITLYPIFKGNVDTWLSDAGFNTITYYKNYKGDLYDGKHLPLIVVAR